MVSMAITCGVAVFVFPEARENLRGKRSRPNPWCDNGGDGSWSKY